jgi:Ca2+-binding RTX toxin-like protein
MPRREFRLLATAGISGYVAAFALLAGSESTYAAFSDFDSQSVNVGAGIWAPDPPAACEEILSKPHAKIVWGTPGDDVLTGGNYPQVLMGLGGDDTLRAGTQGDCLVGGDGDDKLYGDNAKDVLLGGAGNDLLNGGNSPDYLDGGEGDDGLDGGNGPDTCIGGGGDDTIVNCEAGSPAPPDATLAGTVDSGEAKLTDDALHDDEPVQDTGAASGDEEAGQEETPTSPKVAVDDPAQPSDEPAAGDQAATSAGSGVTATDDVADPQPAIE